MLSEYTAEDGAAAVAAGACSGLQGAARERAMFDTGSPASDLYDILRVGPTCFQKSSGFCVHCCDVVLRSKGAGANAGAGSGSSPPMTVNLTKSAIQAAWHRKGSTMCLSPALMAHFGLKPAPGTHTHTVVAATATATATSTDAQRRLVWVLVSQLLAALPVEERPSWGRAPSREWFTTVLPILRDDNVTVAGWAEWERTHDCPPRIRGFVNAALAEVAKLQSGSAAPAVPAPAVPVPAPPCSSKPVDPLFSTRREDSLFAAGGNGWAGRTRTGATFPVLRQQAFPGFPDAPRRPVAPGAFLRPTFDGDQDGLLLPGAVPRVSPAKAPVPDVLWAWKRDSTQGPTPPTTISKAAAATAAAAAADDKTKGDGLAAGKKPADVAGEKAKGLPAASGEGEAVPKAGEETKAKGPSPASAHGEGVATFSVNSKGADGMAKVVTDDGRELKVRLVTPSRWALAAKAKAPSPARAHGEGVATFSVQSKGADGMAKVVTDDGRELKVSLVTPKPVEEEPKAAAVIKVDTIAPEVRKALYPALPALPAPGVVPSHDYFLVIGSRCEPCDTDPSACTHVCQRFTGKDRCFVDVQRLPRDVIAALIADKRDDYSPEMWNHFCL